MWRQITSSHNTCTNSSPCFWQLLIRLSPKWIWISVKKLLHVAVVYNTNTYILWKWNKQNPGKTHSRPPQTRLYIHHCCVSELLALEGLHWIWDARVNRNTFISKEDGWWVRSEFQIRKNWSKREWIAIPPLDKHVWHRHRLKGQGSRDLMPQEGLKDAHLSTCKGWVPRRSIFRSFSACLLLKAWIGSVPF